MRSIKVVMVGDTRVGKSCILNRLVNGNFDRNMPATIGAAFMSKVIQTDAGAVRLQLWDTAGQEKFRSLAPIYYRSSSVAVLVYDVTSLTSLESLKEWRSEVISKAPPDIKLVVIGNKADLVDERVVQEAAGQELSKQLGATLFAEVSAESGSGISEIFAKIANFEMEAEPILEKRILHNEQPAERKKSCC